MRLGGQLWALLCQCTGRVDLDTEWPRPGAVRWRRVVLPACPSFGRRIVGFAVWGGGGAAPAKFLSCENKRRWKGNRPYGSHFSAKSILVCSAEKGSRERGWHITELEQGESKTRFPSVPSPEIQKFLKQSFFFSLPYPIPKTRGKGLVCFVKINVQKLSVPGMCQAWCKQFQVHSFICPYKYFIEVGIVC